MDQNSTEQAVVIMEDDTVQHNVMARDCHLHVKANETIKWFNHTKTPYTIHFDESPFEGNDFTVRAGEELSKVLKPEVVNKIIGKKIFSYEILSLAVSSAQAADPNVIVHND